MAGIRVKVNYGDGSQSYEMELEDALGMIQNEFSILESRIKDLEEVNEHLSDGLESAKTKIQHLEECEIKKTTSLFQTILEALKIKPKSRLKETTVTLNEGNKI